MKTSKIKTVFVCQECGYSTPKWLGKCPECSAWNTFVEEKVFKQSSSSNQNLTEFSSEITPINDVSLNGFSRMVTKISEFDRIIGGGVVPGSMVLLGGPPGIGKSTLMLQVSRALSVIEKGKKVLYVSGEESCAQVKSRADRLGIKSDNLYLVSETNLENIVSAIDKVKSEIVIIDSIQTTYRNDVLSAPGSVSQVRECAAELLRISKSKNITVFILGHVTKEGSLAGPRVLEHIVDTVLYFESEKQQLFRILRVYKNRFGPTNEIGVFEMKTNGLNEVLNPSEIFLTERSTDTPGNVVVVTIEGTRPILLEVQALVTRTNFGLPRRMVTGYDSNKVSLLIAVLEKRLNLKLESQDVYINIAGGLKIRETAIDLGICVAVMSSFKNFVPPAGIIFVGEVGLSGEVRSVSQITERLNEAEKLGFTSCVIPKGNMRSLSYKGKIKIHAIERISEVINIFKN